MEISSPFELLKTDELVVKILKMAMDGHDRQILKYKFLVDTIAKVSTRFRRLAADKSLWKDPIVIKCSRKNRIRRFKSFSDFPVSKLVIHYFDNFLEGADIRILANKFPNLEELLLPYIRGWPKLAKPWSSLTSLTLMVDSFDCLTGITLHKTVPNLKLFRLCSKYYATVLPDMTSCEELQVVCLVYLGVDGGVFELPGDPGRPGKIPFPRGLEELHGLDRLNTSISMEEYFDNCAVQQSHGWESECKCNPDFGV